MKNNDDLTRRQIMGASLGLGLAITSSSRAASIENSVSTDLNFESTVKLLGSLKRESAYTSFQGTLSGIVADKTPTVICGYQGLARTDWQPLKTGGFSKRSFDIGFFSDLNTGEPLDKVLNPLNNEVVKPLHFQYGGAPAKEFTQEMANEYQWSQLGDQVWLSESGAGEFDHPMPMDKWAREASGKKLHYRSETNYVSSIDKMTSPHSAPYSLFWSSLLSWEPWLLMGQTQGFNMWRGVGVKLKTVDEVPTAMQRYLAKHQPNYFDEQAPWHKRISSFDRFMNLRSPSK